MKKEIVIVFLSIIYCWNIQAENEFQGVSDTIQSKYLEEIVISSSTKETNDLRTLPGSVSFITPRAIEGRKIITIKDLSTIIPNFFIPDYGSKFSVPVYIRGIGERSTGQSIGMYVDNMPYLDKSTFDFEFMNIAGIEVLRGPQGTLYGRNAMSGIVNVMTYSPLQSQYKKISLTGGNYGLFRAKASISELLSENVGISVNGYYDGHDGYFTNQLDGKKADQLQSGGTRLRLDWKINPNWTAQWMANYDYSDQGAFPYGLYENGKIAAPNTDYQGKYIRQVAGSNLNLRYTNEKIIFNSSTGFQYFDDDMKMDLDNSPLDAFTNRQIQNQRVWTGELTVKSNTNNNYQWSFGTFGFYTDLKTDVVTRIGTDGISELQKVFADLKTEYPRMPSLTVMDTELPIQAYFDTPSYGAAFFRQSTYNNLFIDGLSLTAGIRLDYEKQKMQYNSEAKMLLNMYMPPMPPGRPEMNMDISNMYDATVMDTLFSQEFVEILPKVSLKYELNKKQYVYFSIAKGYKTGGYNIQNSKDVMQENMQYDVMSAFGSSFPDGIPSQFIPTAMNSMLVYKPEYSWNYEIGFKGEIVKDLLYAEVAAYYIDINDIQITDFAQSGQGRLLKNAGKAKSTGVDVSLSASITNDLSFTANYGLTKATFKDYKTTENDYTDNYIPFAPQNTFSLSGAYTKRLQQKWIDRLSFQAQYNGAGRIYWTEENNVYQDFYGLLNVRAGANKGIVGVNLWANNLLNEKYTAFYFESMGRNLAQQGRPFTFGIDVSLSLK